MRFALPGFFRTVLCLPLLFLVLGVSASAQFRAGLQGSVTDPQGAAVTGATVTLTNKETNKTLQTTSGDEGYYRFDQLGPGNYTVTVEMAGFSKKQLENVQVRAEEVQGLNIALETGAVTETVTVTSNVTEQLQTENANIGGNLSTREIQRLPQVGRDPYELVRLTPGVFGLGARNASGGSQGLPNRASGAEGGGNVFATENRPEVSANGQRAEANNIQIDGVNAMSQAWGGAAVVTPSQESVKEIRVVANNYSAEFGRASGAQVLVVSQSGANDFHGSLFFKRNTPGLNSTQDFTRTGTALREDPQRVNQFLSQYGGSVGGPILKNRLFFFFTYETVRANRSRVESFWIETPQYVSQVQSKRPNSIANQILSFPGMTPPRVAGVQNVNCAIFGITDPTKCQQVTGGLDIGSPGGTLGQKVSSVGGGLDGIPDVQFAGLTLTSKNKSEQFNTRIDYQVTQKDLVAFSMFFVPNTTNANDNGWGDRARPGLDFNSGRRNTVGTLLWTRTLSPTMINEARFNVTRWYFDEVKSNPKIGYGIPDIRVFDAQFIPFATHTGPGVFFQNTYNFRDTLSKVTNAHGLKFGIDVIREQNNDRAPWAGRPTFNFDGLWNFANDAPTSEGQTFFDPKTGAFTDLAAYPRSEYYGIFAQDDWKVRPNLTLNLGLRWDYFTPLRSKRNRIPNIVLGPNEGLVGASIISEGNLYKPDRNNFGPQIGFAWSPKTIIGHDMANKAVMRGGFGIGYNRLPGSRLLETRFNPPFFAGFFLDQPGSIRYGLASDLNSFNYPANPAAVLTFDPATGLPASGSPVSFTGVAQNAKNPMVYRYSLTTEYDVGAGWIASIGYQGSAGRSLPRPVPYQLFVTPNPRLGNVNLLRTDAYSNFNALLIDATHRFSQGFQFNAEYRFSKSLDTCSNDQDCRSTYPFNQKLEYGPSDFDVTHAFRAYGVWAPPIFRNRRDFLGRVVGGWELSAIVTASSGFPWTPVVGGSACGVVVAGGGVCPLRPIAQIKSVATNITSNSTFLGAGQFPGGGLLYFTPPPAGSFTTPPVPGVGRNSLRGPGYFSTDMTIVKRFGIPSMRVLGENAGFEIRANIYNLFNRGNLSPFNANDDNTQIQHPDFGRAIHVLVGRTAEIQARFSF